MGLRPVNRIKHVVDQTGTLSSPTIIVNVLASAVDAPLLANTNQVAIGSKINGIYLRVEVAANEQILGAIPQVYMSVTKNPGNNITAPDPSAVGANDNKRFVIHQEMVMLQNVRPGNPRTLFNGVIVIPKGYRRMGPSDQIQCSILCPVLNIAFCLQCHYKEFR